MIAVTAKNNVKKNYKIIISLISGLIGFGINFQAVHFDFPAYQTGLLPGLVFPMAVALAWGWPYGLLSATFGLGCQTAWFSHWPHEAWKPVMTIPMITLWITWHGWCANRKKKGLFPAMNPYWAEIPFRVGHLLIVYILLRWVAGVDPTSEVPNNTSLDDMHYLTLAHVLNAYVVLLLADVVLNLGAVRRLFRLRQRPGQITTGYVISAALLFGLLFWVIDGLVDYYKFREQLRFLIFKAPENVLDSIILNVSSPDLFGRMAFVAVCLIGGLLVSRLLRKQLEGEAALRESEIRYRRLHETMRDAFVQLDMEGRIIDFNPAYQEMIAHEEEDLWGLQHTELTPSKWHDVEEEIFRTQVIRLGRSHVYEKEYIHADGTIFPVELRTFLIQDDEDHPIGMWSIVRDITQRKHIESERENAMRSLEKSNRDLKQFAYVASHDLQEPLRMVSSYMQLLEERYKNHLDDKAHKYIHYAVDGAARMQALIRDLLAFSRLETHTQEFQTVDAQGALGAAIVNLKAMIDESGALVVTDDLPTVLADNTQLSLLFQNLISNGIKFQKKCKTPRIRVSADQQADSWRFSVRDNGIGIESKYKEKIFQVFQRLHTRLEYPGTGIGLALCKRIIDCHGGQIWFESVPGEGTTFYFTIPHTEKEATDGLCAVG